MGIVAPPPDGREGGSGRTALLAWHPVGFSVAYVLNAYVAESVSPFAAVRAFAVAVVVAALLQLGFRLLMRDWQRGALGTTVVLAFFVLGRDLLLIAQNAVRVVPSWQLFLICALVIAAGALAIRIGRSSSVRGDRVARVSSGLNVLAAALLLVVLITGALSGSIGQTLADLPQGATLAAAPDRGTAPRAGPDVYLILLDGHARADVMADRFGSDDRTFVHQLETRGFDVAPASHSNYLLTQLTLISMFHMALLPDVPAMEPVLAGRGGERAARHILGENPAFAFLRDHGYTTVAFEAQAESVTLRQADVFVDNSQMTEFEGQLIAGTFLLDLIQWAMPDLLPGAQRARILGAFENLGRVAEDPSLGPKFVFGHVAAPHTPFVFGPDGEPVDVPIQRRLDDTAKGLGLTDAEFTDRLVGQTAYVDDRTIEAIDAILTASPDPPVIIVMSDHGPRSKDLDLAAATPDDIRERFGTLFAAYTPGRVGIFRQNETPAAVLVHLLNAYFDADLAEPGDGTFVSLSGHPFVLRPIDMPAGPD